MTMNLSDFTQIVGKTSGKGGFKNNPNSITNQVYQVVKTAYNEGKTISESEVISALPNIENDKVTMTLTALAYDKRNNAQKQKQTRLLRGYPHDTKGNPIPNSEYEYTINPLYEYPTVTENVTNSDKNTKGEIKVKGKKNK